MKRVIPGALALALFLTLLPSNPKGNLVPEVMVESFQSAAPFYSAWKIKKWVGNVDVDFLHNGAMPFVRLTSDNSSWAFLRKVSVDLKETPMLTWTWEADALPPGGDGRYRATDDEAAQVYVLFPGRGLLGSLDYRILGYTWETVPAAGTFYASPKNSNVRVFVLRSKRDGLKVWKHEIRDVAADFKRAFGTDAPNPVAFSFQIDSDDTHSFAQSGMADIAFKSR
jgi:hypothetical protein